MDKTIYLLSQVVVLDYRQDALQVIYGVKNFSLTKVEKTSKNVADEIDTVTACSMIECVNENVSNYHMLFSIITNYSYYIRNISANHLLWMKYLIKSISPITVLYPAPVLSPLVYANICFYCQESSLYHSMLFRRSPPLVPTWRQVLLQLSMITIV
ncbi:unnamed protein product [Absidia cylindrospora]